MEAPDRFALGRVYRRSDLHDEYGGQRQGGIATPREHPLVFIFSGSAGSAYGYEDEWDEDGTFRYFGEGQLGDMKFSGGNAAIRNHAENEEEIHLFETLKRSGARYLGEMVCAGYEWRTAKDKAGDDRQAIVFQLVRAAALPEFDDAAPPQDASLSELAAAADADPSEESSAEEGLRRTYARSKALRRYVRARAGGICEGCGEAAPFVAKSGTPYLEAHHTNRRSDSGPGDRGTVIALCPNCHSRVHYGRDGDEFNLELKAKLKELQILE
jgi:5-methylcytosine-specific restriction protein A